MDTLISANPPFCFLDIETTGHDSLKRVDDVLVPWHEIIEIGTVFVNSQSLNICGEFEIKVRPKHPERCLLNLVNDYPERSLAGEWDNAVSLDIAINNFFGYCNKFKLPIFLVGQNFSFDWLFLNIAFTWCGTYENGWQKYFHYSRLDTRSMAVQELFNPSRPYDPNDYSIRNERLAKRLNITQEPYPHKALNGARQSYLIFKKLREIRKLG